MIGITYILSGVLTIALTHYRPSAYWNSRTRKFWRQLLGDWTTIAFYQGIGIGMVILGMTILTK
jgi:hypothetical protein